ncbi:Phosphatidylserine decarboxylase proenzyme [Fasciola gigantica]|uniref:phosphatidylserine decarboxylase n=1 Tax=Fasciola gigantica TaxID=46835 RepID=A0A504YM53_FASGI|nr:Phosphatidylserine decarboxylase proenzyme [Fasciola gigantica]
MLKIFSRIGLFTIRTVKPYHGSTIQTQRRFRCPPLLGSSFVVGSYLCFLLLTDNEQPPEYYPDDLSATLLRRLPLNAVSRVICWLAECKVPVSLRPLLYGSYARLFDCDLKELKQSDLKAYPSMVEFFTRELTPGLRPINPTAQLVSPSDGQILHFGPIDPKHEVLEQVKGVRYSLPEFLGPPEHNVTERKHTVWPAKGPTNSGRQLYQCVIYLAPGDCHRFYNPTDWTIITRRHFPGKLLSVRPSIAERLPGLYTINERVVYLGKWAHGFMSFTAVGALAVGGICVPLDRTLLTNTRSDQPVRNRVRASQFTELPYRQQEMPTGACVLKGQEFGRFRFGSTIVLVFEAPTDRVSWCVQIGQQVKFGQALFEIN